MGRGDAHARLVTLAGRAATRRDRAWRGTTDDRDRLDSNLRRRDQAGADAPRSPRAGSTFSPIQRRLLERNSFTSTSAVPTGTISSSGRRGPSPTNRATAHPRGCGTAVPRGHNRSLTATTRPLCGRSRTSSSAPSIHARSSLSRNRHRRCAGTRRCGIRLDRVSSRTVGVEQWRILAPCSVVRYGATIVAVLGGKVIRRHL